MKKLRCLGCLLLLAAGMSLIPLVAAHAEDQPINEDELFSGGQTVDEQSKISETTDQELNKEHFGLSGELTGQSLYTVFEDAFGQKDQLSNTLAADIMLDWRLKGGVKCFINLGAYQEKSYGSTEEEDHDELLKECFVDANWQNRIYFRGGKQVLKWGRSYFWNPTDLINKEKKDFYDLDKNREGTNGVKVHIPSGVKQNVYLFAGLDDGLDELSLAGKYEWLVKNSEMSLSAWIKDGYSPVFGYDLSTRIGKMDWRAEVSLADGKDVKRAELAYDNNHGVYYLNQESVDGWYPQASIGFTRYFNNGNYKDRICLMGEFYYNGAGYGDNTYQEMDKKITEKYPDNPDTAGEKKEQLLGNYMRNYYQPFRNSKYYFALFGTVNKFLRPELTLNVNTMSNLVDYSTVLTTGVTYKPTIKNWSLDFNFNAYIGENATETKLSGLSHTLDVGFKYPF